MIKPVPEQDVLVAIIKNAVASIREEYVWLLQHLSGIEELKGARRKEFRTYYSRWREDRTWFLDSKSCFASISDSVGLDPVAVRVRLRPLFYLPISGVEIRRRLGARTRG